MITKIEEKFYGITGKRLNNVSQLQLFSLMYDSDENIKFVDIFNSYVLNENTFNNTFFYPYLVEHDDWWENISFEVYGTQYLWWVLALVNNVVNPFEELNVGEEIMVLKPTYIYNILKDIKKIGNL